jgi:hypothetical protein
MALIVGQVGVPAVVGDGPFSWKVRDPVYEQGSGVSGDGVEENEERFKVLRGNNCKAIRIVNMGVPFYGFFRQFPGPDCIHVLNGFITHHNNLNKNKKLTVNPVGRSLSMSRGSGYYVIPIAVFLAILLIILPVSASNTTPTTTVATTQTTEVTPTTTVATTQTTEVTPVTTVATTQTTEVTQATTITTTPTTTATPATTVATTKTTVPVTKTTTVGNTTNPTTSGTETGTTGSVTVHSSPTGASILIDGVYSGITPGNVDGLAAGNHILRLTLSGYYDYEGSIYIVPEEENQAYGTLQPTSQVVSTEVTPVPTVIIPVIVTVATPLPTQDTGLLGNSGVLVAIIGVITAAIASGATIFTHVKPPKK